MEPVVYGRLGIRPWVFGRMTPREVSVAIRGRLDAEAEQRIYLASVVAPLINLTTPKRLSQKVRAEDLLGEGDRERLVKAKSSQGKRKAAR